MARAPDSKPTDYTGLAIGAAVLPVYLGFILAGREEMGRSVAVVLGMVILAARIRWDLRAHAWFWAVIVIVLALHVLLLLYLRWPSGLNGWLPAVGMLPIALADVLIIVGILRFVEKYVVRSPASEEQ